MQQVSELSIYLIVFSIVFYSNEFHKNYWNQDINQQSIIALSLMVYGNQEIDELFVNNLNNKKISVVLCYDLNQISVFILSTHSFALSWI